MSVNLSKADSPFALLYKAIENNYQPKEKKSFRNSEAYEVYEKAENFIEGKSFKFSLGIDDKFAYIYLGAATTSFALDEPEFKKKFTKSINEHTKL